MTESAALLPAVELETGPAPDAAVIWLHGLGADGNDFVPIVEELPLPPGLALRFVFPHAPVRAVTINNGVRMRAWYDIRAADFTARADLAGVRESQRQVEALIGREQDRGIAPGRIVVAGFSQGGAIALHAGLRHAGRLAAVIALSTYLVDPDLVAGRSQRRQSRPAGVHGARHPGSGGALRVGRCVAAVARGDGLRASSGTATRCRTPSSGRRSRRSGRSSAGCSRGADRGAPGQRSAAPPSRIGCTRPGRDAAPGERLAQQVLDLGVDAAQVALGEALELDPHLRVEAEQERLLLGHADGAVSCTACRC